MEYYSDDNLYALRIRINRNIIFTAWKQNFHRRKQFFLQCRRIIAEIENEPTGEKGMKKSSIFLNIQLFEHLIEHLNNIRFEFNVCLKCHLEQDNDHKYNLNLLAVCLVIHKTTRKMMPLISITILSSLKEFVASPTHLLNYFIILKWFKTVRCTKKN